MNTQVAVMTPRLAAFGAPIWAYKPVRILGFQVAAAVVVAVIGLAMLAVPIILAFVIGGELNTAHDTNTTHAPPTSYTVVDTSPISLPEAFTAR